VPPFAFELQPLQPRRVFVMAEVVPSEVPQPTPEQHRVAAGQYERANQVAATGNYDYAIQLLLGCCKLDPSNLIYRQALRRVEKIKFGDNLRGSRLAFLTNPAAKTKLKSAKAARSYVRVLEIGEDILSRNPWDVGTQMEMSEAAEALGLGEVAVWFLEQARHKDPMDVSVNRALARLYERRGNFAQAIALWERIRKAVPRDTEAQHKAKDLAAADTIARGNYEAVVGPKKDPSAGSLPVGRMPNRGTPAEDNNLPLSEREPREAPVLRARIEKDPANPAVYLHLASVYRRADQFDKARKVLEDGLAPTGHHFELSIELAALDIEPFRRNLAITEEKLRANPADQGLLQIQHQLSKEVNSRELELFRLKADRFPIEMGHRVELGIRLLRAGQTDAAIVELQAARSDPRHRCRALIQLGHCFSSKKNWTLAQRNYEEALQILPASQIDTRKELMFLLAKGAAESGDLVKAVELGCELAHLDFGYGNIGTLIEDWQARMQKA
jgi:tetratricopeptide (TPR) repeat protein